MKLDEALSLLGAYGRYQLIVFAIISVFDNFPSIMHMSIMTFIGFEPLHRCTVSIIRSLSLSLSVKRYDLVYSPKLVC